MNDKKHDELEALLIERAENLNDPEAYHGDIAEVMLKAADAIAELRVKNAALVGALEFYADPDTYVAISFFEDRPCGEFMDDFGPDDDEEYQRPMPGKRARKAIKENTQ